MSRSGVGHKNLPELKELLSLNSAVKPQESHSNSTNINKTSVMKTFEGIDLISDGYPRD